MKEKNSNRYYMKLNTETLAVSAIFIASTVSIGFVFSPVPNLELMTALIFLGGYILGKKGGFFIGIFSTLLWSSLNPWGSGIAYPSILAAQSAGFAIAGIAGGLCRHFVNPSKINLKDILFLGVSGLIITALYDILTNIGGLFFSGFDYKMMRNVLLAGIPLSFLHIGSNSIIFMTLVPSLIKTLNKTGFIRKYFYNGQDVENSGQHK